MVNVMLQIQAFFGWFQFAKKFFLLDLNQMLQSICVTVSRNMFN